MVPPGIAGKFMRHQPIGRYACAIWPAGESARSQPGKPLWPFPGEERARDAGRMMTTGTSAQAAQAISLRMTHGVGQAAMRALRDVNATFERVRFMAVMDRRARGSRRSCTAGLADDVVMDAATDLTNFGYLIPWRHQPRRPRASQSVDRKLAAGAAGRIGLLVQSPRTIKPPCLGSSGRS
jgi:hypothetical protein